eukprot:scaffold40410_cov394-Skeletonema_marinoi.AAC.1
MFIAGPGYTGTGIQTGYVSGSDDGNINEGAVILQGFLPEDVRHVGEGREPRAQGNKGQGNMCRDSLIMLSHWMIQQ